MDPMEVLEQALGNEIRAFSRIVDLLEQLDELERERVLRWVARGFGLEAEQKAG